MSLLIILLQEVAKVAVDLVPIMKLVTSLAAGMIVFGAAWGIGSIGRTALEGIARQPEAANSIQTTMVVSAALVEGISFFALVVCLLIVL